MILRTGSLVALCLTVAACATHKPTEFESQLFTGDVYLCCNFHYYGEVATDANWYVDAFVPAGTSVEFHEFGDGYAKITTGDASVYLYHKYGVAQESTDQFYGKLFVRTNPRPRIDGLPERVREAVNESRVEAGMTKEEVLLSVGYPPTHETPSLDANVWKFWWNRWDTYTVHFDPHGRVTEIVPRLQGNEPTKHVAVR